VPPPTTSAGSASTDWSVGGAGGVTVSVAAADDEPSTAVTWTAVAELTVPAVYWNWPEDEPELMVTDAGTARALLFELVRVTAEPPRGAAPLSWIWMVPDAPLAGVAVSGASEVTDGDPPPPPCPATLAVAEPTPASASMSGIVVKNRSARRVLKTHLRPTDRVPV
jgi:hypothetical protein